MLLIYRTNPDRSIPPHAKTTGRGSDVRHALCWRARTGRSLRRNNDIQPDKNSCQRDVDSLRKGGVRKIMVKRQLIPCEIRKSAVNARIKCLLTTIAYLRLDIARISCSLAIISLRLSSPAREKASAKASPFPDAFTDAYQNPAKYANLDQPSSSLNAIYKPAASSASAWQARWRTAEPSRSSRPECPSPPDNAPRSKPAYPARSRLRLP